MDLVSII